MNNYINI